MVTIGMNYFVHEGKGAIFEAACAKVIDLMQSIDGHAESHVYRRVDQGAPVYLIVSRWESDEAFGGFIRSEAFKKVTDWGKQNILTARPTHTTYREG